MKNFFLTTILIIPIFLFSQKHSCTYISNSKNFDFYNLVHSVSNSDDDIRKIVYSITDQYGGFPNFVLQRVEGYGNCAAVTDDKGIRYILYDRDFLQYQAKVSQTNYWAVVFILAHEIGHHINGHNREMLNELDQRNSELQADQFAGFILKKLGGTKEDIIKILDLTGFDLFSYSSTHPAKIDRMNSALTGYDKASFENTTKVNTEIVNSLIYSANQISKNIQDNSINQNVNSLKTVNTSTITGEAYKLAEKHSNPKNWFVSFSSKTFLSNDGCFMYKYWQEDFTYERAPIELKQNPLGAALITNNHGKIYASFDLKGENAFIYNVYSTTKGVLQRNKKVFKVKVKLKNTSDDLFPEYVWTNKERTKLLFYAESNLAAYPYKTIFIDLQGYKEIYDCMNDDQKAKYLNPDRLINLLKTIE